MNTKAVWQLIEQARTDTGGGDAEAVAATMVELLAQRDPAQIVAFAQPLWTLLEVSYRADLWAAAFVINGGASDDGFEYFRGWLLSQGQEAYDQALADPDSLADLPAILLAAEEGQDLEAEDILNVVRAAHLQTTGEELPQNAFTIEYPQLDPDWTFDFEDEDEMRRRLPRLTGLYYDEQHQA